MRKVRYFDWQENVGYEDLNNQACDLRKENEQMTAGNSVQLENVKERNKEKYYAQ